MIRTPLLLILACLPVFATNGIAGEVLDRLFADLDRVQTISCEAERVTRGPPGEIRLLSRVFYQAGRKLHSENIKPAHRRILMDGTTLYLKDDAFPKGFSAPLAELDRQEAWRDQIRRVPGTAAEHLHRIRALGVEEQRLPPTPEFPTVVAFQSPGKLCPVLSVDDQGRLRRIEYFSDETRARRTAVVDYLDYQEFAGHWLSCRQKAELFIGADMVTETARFLNVQVDKPLAASLFDAKAHFEGVAFSDRFDQMR